MKKLLVVLSILFIGILLAGCTSQPTPVVTPTPTADTDSSSNTCRYNRPDRGTNHDCRGQHYCNAKFNTNPDPHPPAVGNNYLCE